MKSMEKMNKTKSWFFERSIKLISLYPGWQEEGRGGGGRGEEVGEGGGGGRRREERN